MQKWLEVHLHIIRQDTLISNRGSDIMIANLQKAYYVRQYEGNPAKDFAISEHKLPES